MTKWRNFAEEKPKKSGRYLCKVYLGNIRFQDRRIPMYTFQCLNYDHDCGIFMTNENLNVNERVEVWSEIDLPPDLEELVNQHKAAWG